MPNLDHCWVKMTSAMMESVGKAREKEKASGVKASQLRHVKKVMGDKQKTLDRNGWQVPSRGNNRGRGRGRSGAGRGFGQRPNPNAVPIAPSRGYAGNGGSSNFPCFRMRDHGRCSFGDRCKFSHDPATFGPGHRSRSGDSGINALMQGLNLDQRQLNELTSWMTGNRQ